MRWLINYVRSCFCSHEWEVIFNTVVKDENNITINHIKTYRCKKCGVEKKYKAKK